MRALEKPIILKLPNDSMVLPIVHANLEAVSSILGFTKNEISKFQLALEEAVNNVIKHAFMPDEEKTFEVIFEPITLGLTVKIKEKGIPFDPSAIEKYKKDKLKADPSAKGLGYYIMKKCVDDVSFHNLGAKGKEIHLTKFLSSKTVEDFIDQNEQKEAIKEINEKPTKEKISYIVRPMKVSEAIEVSKGAYTSYGYSYMNEHIYFPDRVRELLIKNKLISYVAVIDRGEIISHAALKIDEVKDAIELGLAFTKPKYRGQGCLHQINKAILNYAIEKKIKGLIAYAVSTHPYSQKALLKGNFKDCSLCLSRRKAVEFKGIADSQKQRESSVIQFIYITPQEEKVIYPPSCYKEMVQKLYDNLGAKAQLGTYTLKEMPETKSVIDIDTEPYHQLASIYIREYGKDTISEINKMVKKLCIERIETIYLSLDIEDPITEIIVPYLVEIGFFFCGIQPGLKKHDQLLLQFLNNQIVDYDSIVMVSDIGKELKEFIKGQDKNLIS